MQPGNEINKGKRVIFFSLIFLATTLIAAFLIAWVWQTNGDRNIKKTAANFQSPFVYREPANLRVLSARVDVLNELDRQYAQLLSSAASNYVLDSSNKLIEDQERRFRISLDSISLLSISQQDSVLSKLMKTVISDYRSILQNRAAIGSLRKLSAGKSQSASSGNIDLMIAQDMLNEKNDSISLLKNKLKVSGK